jgi:hypothetical protein
VAQDETRLRAGRSGVPSRQGQKIFRFSKSSKPNLGPIQPPCQKIPGAKKEGRGVDPSPPLKAEVTNECSHICTIHACLHSTTGKTLTLTRRASCRLSLSHNASLCRPPTHTVMTKKLAVSYQHILTAYSLAAETTGMFVVFFLLGDYPASCFKIETNVSGPLPLFFICLLT